MISEDYEGIENRYVRFCFDRATGKLASVQNRVTGNELLQGDARIGNIFCAYHDFCREFEIAHVKPGAAPPRGYVFRANYGRTPFRATMPSEITRQTFSPSGGCVASFRARRGTASSSLRITYTDENSRWQASLGVSLKDEETSSIWKMSLKNIGDDPAELMVSFPLISGIKLGSGNRNLMVVNDQAGYILPLWSNEGGIYGNARYMSMQWGCVFDEQSRDAFGFIVRDPEIRNKQIRYIEPSIEVSYFPPLLLEPGQSVSFPPVEILVYTGDWKKAAVAYSKWFSRHFKPVKHAKWVRNIDGQGNGWFEKRGSPINSAEARVNIPLNSFAELADLFRYSPVDNFELAYFCRRSMPEEVTGKVMLWTDGDNVLREDMGGAQAFREGMREVHKLGSHFTFYIEGILCPGDADIALQGDAQEWAMMNKDGTNDGNYTEQGRKLGCGLLHMCVGAEGWQNHLARTCARLVRETGADGVRIDSLGFYSYPCYNPAHNHATPFDYNVWIRQLLARVAATVRKENPDCLLTTEAGADFFSSFFDGCLTQPAKKVPYDVAISRDVAPMRIAIPDYCVLVHNPFDSPCGPVATSLLGYPGGSIGVTNTSPRMQELDLKWRSVRHAGAEVIRWGNAAHDNPMTSRQDVECRRFSSDTMEVIVGARPVSPANWKDFKTASTGCSEDPLIDLKKGRVTYRVFVATEGRKPLKVLVWDVEKLEVKEVEPAVEDGETSFEVSANWFMAILGYQGCPPVAQLNIPSVLRRGSSTEIQGVLLGASGERSPDGDTIAGKVFAPVFGIEKAITMRIPGTLRVQVPDSLPPGHYRVQLDSNHFLGYRCFVEVG